MTMATANPTKLYENVKNATILRFSQIYIPYSCKLLLQGLSVCQLCLVLLQIINFTN